MTGPIQLQLRLGETVLDPDAMFERRVEFASGVVEARLTQAPLALHLGQAMLTGPSGTARLSGRVAFEAEGLRGAFQAAIPRMRVGEVVALAGRPAGGRPTLDRQVISSPARSAMPVPRCALSPARRPTCLPGSISRTRPSGTCAACRPHAGPPVRCNSTGTRLAVRLDRGEVPVDGARVDIADSRIVLPDLAAGPPRAEILLRATGDIGDVLTLLDNRPFRLLERLSKTRDLASGTILAEVTAGVPLRPGNAPADIDYAVTADLRDVESTRIVPGRRIAASALTLRVDPEAVEIGGDLTFEGMPFTGTWRQALPPRSSTIPIVPAPPPRRRRNCLRPGW